MQIQEYENASARRYPFTKDNILGVLLQRQEAQYKELKVFFKDIRARDEQALQRVLAPAKVLKLLDQLDPCLDVSLATEPDKFSAEIIIEFQSK